MLLNIFKYFLRKSLVVHIFDVSLCRQDKEMKERVTFS